MFGNAFEDARVLVTGHTGFKGSWLCEWLLDLGAAVHGIGLDPPTTPALFDQLGLADRVQGDWRIDLRDAGEVSRKVSEIGPDFVFHLAAQPLVRTSYDEPLGTVAVNVMGTLHLLEAIRDLDDSCAVVIATTDKVYQNREWFHGYRETDPLGGHDPYSASKAAVEILSHSWRRSFFDEAEKGKSLATARAGNVIGGGDWARDRIVPDCVRALQSGNPIEVRNPSATRPWQHVLEPLSGYLWLAAVLRDPGLAKVESAAVRDAFNLGPESESNRSVADLVGELLRRWPGEWRERGEAQARHEAGLLHLSIDKARAILGWAPVWDFATAVEKTIAWYRAANVPDEDSGLDALCRDQIRDFGRAASEKKMPWAEN